MTLLLVKMVQIVDVQVGKKVEEEGLEAGEVNSILLDLRTEGLGSVEEEAKCFDVTGAVVVSY